MKKILNWLKKIKKELQPPRFFSWQTMILLSAFSWGIALLDIGLTALKEQQSSSVYNLISNIGWIFFILGFHWLTIERKWLFNGFPIGAWFTGFFTCIYIFVWVFGDINDKYPALPFVIWPLISAGISTFYKINYTRINDKKLPLTTIQDIVVLILISLLLSCWVQFHFVVQGWLQEYPSLLADKFDRSAFLVKIELPTDKPEPARGYKIISAVEKLIQSKVNNKPWQEVEKWLTESNKQLQGTWSAVSQWILKLNGIPKAVKNKILLELEEKKEDNLWYIEAKIEERVADYYQLVLKVIWRGPTWRSQGYELTKNCQIEPIIRAKVVGRMQCKKTINTLKEENASYEQEEEK